MSGGLPRKSHGHPPGHHPALRCGLLPPAVGSLWLCLALCTLQAETVPSLPHLTDGQDRPSLAALTPKAEAISQANALYAEAVCNGSEANTAASLYQFRQIAALDPHFVEAQVKIANILLQSGQFESALQQLQTAAKANPGSIAIETALGYTQRLRGHNDEALRLCRDALTHDSSQVTAMRVILEVAVDKDDLAGGVQQVKSILQAAGPSVPVSAWLTLARLYVDVARSYVHPSNREAILETLLPIYQQAASIMPTEIDTLSLLADTYRDLGRKHEALKTLKKAIDLEPANVDILLRCADLETELGWKTEALHDYEQAYNLNPSLTGLREMLAQLYLDNARFADAARLLQEALVDTPDNADLEIDLGIAYEGSHQEEKADACFQKIFTSAACPPEAYLKLAVFQLARQQVTEAGKTLAAAEKRFPDSAKIRFYQGIQCRYDKKYDEALQRLDEAHELATASGSTLLDTGYYLECALTMNLAGHKNRLEQTLREGLARYPDNPDLMNELAYFWADQCTHLSEALSLSKRAVELEPDNGPILDTRGWVFFQLGRPKDALPYLQRAAIMTNNDPVVLQHIGDAFLKLGHRREAIAAWQLALEKAPHNGDLANRIDAAQAQANNAHLRSAPHP
ncbi:MAG: tetratricopeptide repeat protein [Methylacidiphilales bacterium]|nr:tetratricopeptide repeat protein [Candidatus Methylacidiphilales bacterium]